MERFALQNLIEWKMNDVGLLAAKSELPLQAIVGGKGFLRSLRGP